MRKMRVVGDRDILAFVQRQHVDVVPAAAQELEHRPHGQGCAPGLKERVRGEHENFHASDPDGEPFVRSCSITSSISDSWRSVDHPSSAPAMRAAVASVSAVTCAAA